MKTQLIRMGEVVTCLTEGRTTTGATDRDNHAPFTGGCGLRASPVTIQLGQPPTDPLRLRNSNRTTQPSPSPLPRPSLNNTQTRRRTGDANTTFRPLKSPARGPMREQQHWQRSWASCHRARPRAEPRCVFVETGIAFSRWVVGSVHLLTWP